MRIYTWLISVLEKLNCQHVCSLSLAWVGYLHRRLGHDRMKQLNKLIKHDLVRGLKDVIFEKDKLCSACQAGKQVGNTHPKKSMMSTSKAFELVNMDLFGPTTWWKQIRIYDCG